MTITDTARKIAKRAHSFQYRRDGVTPYVTHPERVASRFPDNLDAQAVAWLHDVLEDTSETEVTLLEAGISPKIITAIKILTKTPNRSYADYLISVKTNTLARQVKIQDMLDNLSDSPTEGQIVKYARGLLALLNYDP